MLLNFDQMWQVIGRETTSSHRQEKNDSRRRREQGGKGLGKRKGTFRGKKKTNKKKQKPDGSAAKPWQGRVDVCVDRTKTL